LEIISVHFDVLNELQILYPAFVRY